MADPSYFHELLIASQRTSVPLRYRVFKFSYTWIFLRLRTEADDIGRTLLPRNQAIFFRRILKRQVRIALLRQDFEIS